MKKFLTAFILFLLVIVMPLSACTAEAGFDAEAYTAKMLSNQPDRTITYSADVTIYMAKSKIGAAHRSIKEKCDLLGGFTKTAEEDYSSIGYSYVSVIYKIPTEKLDEFLDFIDGKSGSVSKTVTSVDITSAYVDAQAKKQALINRKTALENMLSEALTTTEKLSVLEDISEVDAEILQLEITLNDYDDMLSYSTVSIYISENTWYIPVVILVLPACLAGLTIAVIFIVRGVIRKKKTQTPPTPKR